METEMEIRVKISNANTLRAHTMVYLRTIYWTGLGEKKLPARLIFFHLDQLIQAEKCAMKCLPQAISLLPRGLRGTREGRPSSTGISAVVVNLILLV